MRNGNKCTSKTVPSSNSCSYPTYEEWKPSFQRAIMALTICVLILPMRNGNVEDYDYIAMGGFLSSYPTYEEWKLTWMRQMIKNQRRSYPTYEEWKQQLKVESETHRKLFLSYL